jgi:hypothetical protein
MFEFSIDDEEGSITYDYKRFLTIGKGKSEAVLMFEAPQIYCELICHKICIFLKQIHGVEIIRMTLNFLQDEF